MRRCLGSSCCSPKCFQVSLEFFLVLLHILPQLLSPSLHSTGIFVTGRRGLFLSSLLTSSSHHFLPRACCGNNSGRRAMASIGLLGLAISRSKLLLRAPEHSHRCIGINALLSHAKHLRSWSPHNDKTHTTAVKERTQNYWLRQRLQKLV